MQNESSRPFGVRLFITGLMLSLLSTLHAAPWQAAQREPVIAQNLAELGDSALENAQLSWAESLKDSRKVVDTVCLVPNRETFLEALATWDDATYFPILIDDTDLSIKFIRAFKPKKVVRFPSRAAPVTDENIWPLAVTNALRGMLSANDKPKELIKGNVLWLQKQPRSPGLVLTKGGSDTIAAAALAAGRKQGLILWADPKKWGDLLTTEEAVARISGVENLSKELKVRAEGLGDDLDFLTLVGDMPYRYKTPDGENSFDDLLGRKLEDPKRRRWAFTGRITGDMKQQVYQVMCGLFLQPQSATLFNGYDPTDKRFKGYQLAPAQTRLDAFGLNSIHVRDGSLGNWRKTFLPVNKAEMLMINSSGNPTSFNLQSGSVGSTWDVPWTVPTRIHIIHSFSAADAQDPYTLAGRWLANGAYAYYGSMNEPYLQSFRSASLISECLTKGYPWAAATRQNPETEMFGNPWRLMVVGDPMLKLIAQNQIPARVSSETVQNWPSFSLEAIPQDSEEPLARLAWGVRQTLVWASAKAEQEGIKAKDIVAVIRKIDRTKLPQGVRSIRDELAAHLTLEAHQYEQSLELADEVPDSERSIIFTRMIESGAMARYQQGLSKGDLEEALPAWRVLVANCPRSDLREPLTAPIRPMASTPVRKRIWIRTLDSLQSRSGASQELKDWATKEITDAEKAKK